METELERLYDELCEKPDLSEEDLKTLGIKESYVLELIKSNIIKLNCLDNVEIDSLEKLYNFALEMVDSNKLDKALAYLVKCFKDSKDNCLVLFELFTNSILNNDTKKMYLYFQVFEELDEIEYTPDFKFYIYLSSVVYDNLPQKFYDYAKSIDTNDIYLKNGKDNALENQFRKLMSQHRYEGALTIIQHLEQQKKNEMAECIVQLSKHLLNRINEQELIEREKIILLISEERYYAIIDYYKVVANRFKLSIYKSSLVNLCYTIIRAKSQKILPPKKAFKIKNVFGALYSNDYQSALAFSEEYIEINNIEPSSNAIYLLLKALNKYVIDNNISQETIETDIPTKSEKEDINIDKVKVYLESGNLDYVLFSIHSFLKEHNKLEYEQFLFSFAKLVVCYKIENIHSLLALITELLDGKLNFNKEESVIAEKEELQCDLKQSSEPAILEESKAENFHNIIVENEIEEKKIIILGPYESTKSADDYIFYLSKYDDIKAFSMYEEGNLYVVALYKERLNCYINTDDLVSTANNKFDEGEVKLAIDLLTIACAYDNEMNPYIYYKLLCIYQKRGDYEKSLSYCRVCQVLNISYGNNKDLTLVLKNLKAKSLGPQYRAGVKA